MLTKAQQRTLDLVTGTKDRLRKLAEERAGKPVDLYTTDPVAEYIRRRQHLRKTGEDMTTNDAVVAVRAFNQIMSHRTKKNTEVPS